MRNAPLQITSLNVDRQVDNEELVSRILDDDTWAVEVFYQRFVHKITGIVAKLLRCRADVEDAVQETFIQAFRDMNQLREPKHVERWLVRIAVHRAHHRFRRRALKRRLGLDRSLDDESLTVQATDTTPPDVRAELALLDRAFDNMKMVERSTFVLRYFEGYRLEEVADATGASLATVKRRITRAKEVIDRHTKEAVRDV